jgi:hypothetical protein
MPIQVADTNNFQDQVIRLWTVMYDNDADRVYSFFDWSRVCSSVEGSIRTYLDEDSGPIDELVSTIMEKLGECENKPYIPILFARKGYKFKIDVFRWEIDSHTKLGKVLNKCYDQVDDSVKMELLDLFSNGR